MSDIGNRAIFHLYAPKLSEEFEASNYCPYPKDTTIIIAQKLHKFLMSKGIRYNFKRYLKDTLEDIEYMYYTDKPIVETKA